MANLKITELDALSTQPADDDLLPIVDTSDTTDSANGTTKKIAYDTMIPDASATVYGRAKLSTAPASATAPIAVGDNDTRVPTQGENDALVGTSGTPSSTNKYVTNDDTAETGNSKVVRTTSGGLLNESILPTSVTTRAQYTVGALNNSLVKTYFNFQYPFTLWIGDTDGALTTTVDNWVITDTTKVVIPPGGAMCNFASTGLCVATLSAPLYNAVGTKLSFDHTNIIILDWWAKLAATGTDDVSMGFAGDAGNFDESYDATNMDRVMVTQDITDGKIYATASKSGANCTNTEITGVTVTNWNNYRIELDLSNNALFYVNGVLKATLSGTNFPTSSDDLIIGFGRKDTNLFTVTAPTISLQMNP